MLTGKVLDLQIGLLLTSISQDDEEEDDDGDDGGDDDGEMSGGCTHLKAATTLEAETQSLS